MYALTNTYRCVEEQLFCIFIAVRRIHLLRLPLQTPFLWVTASIYVDISSLAIQTISTNQVASCFKSARETTLVMWSSKWSKMATENCSLCDQKFNYQAKRKRFDRAEIESKLKRRDHTITYGFFQLSFCFILMITWPELSPYSFGSKTRFDWSKSFDWLRRRCQHRLKRWPINMGFRGVIWANVYGEPRWICRKLVPLHIGRCLWAHTR